MTTQQQFITERRYLKSVTPATVTWYEQAFKRFEGALDSRADAIERIGVLKARGLSVVSINCHLRVCNAFWHWREGKGEKCSPQCEHIHIPRLKEEQKILSTLTESDIRRIIAYRPRGTNITRAQLVALAILDTGLRASEVLGLTKENIDFQNLTLRVIGKGNKHRLVPFSQELRRILWRYLKSEVSG